MHSPAAMPHRVIRRRAMRIAAGLLAILCIALAARLYGLTYHSLWFDEAMSTFWAAKPADQIWQVGMTLTQDKHPPLYYLLLHFWTVLFGSSDAAVRALGVGIGALAVLPAFGIGAALGGWRAGVIGALFMALNPFLVWYSQEARMFMPATTFLLVGLYGTLLLWGAGPHKLRGRPSEAGAAAAGRGEAGPLIAGFCLVTVGFTAALYSYLFCALLLPVALAWGLVLWRLALRSGEGDAAVKRSLATNLVALGAVGLLFLPLARAAWSVSGQESLPGHAFEGLAAALGRLLQVYSLGWPAWPPQALFWIVLGAVLLALLGLAVPFGRKSGGAPMPVTGPASTLRPGAVLSSDSDLAAVSRATMRWGGLLLALWLLLPVVTGGVLLARDRTVFSELRYFIFLAPALCLAWGRGLAWLWERWRPAGLVGVALAFGVTLAALPADWSAQTRREAWRETAALIESLAGPNDAVLIAPDYVYPALTRYLPKTRPIYYPFTQRLDDPAEVDGPLLGLRDYDAVWLVQSHDQALDPDGLVAGWFGARYPLLTEAYPAGIALHAFIQHYRSPALPAAVPPLDKEFGNLRLLGCVIGPTELKARDDLYHPPSGWVHATTYWSAETPVEGDIYPQVRLEDATGQVWGRHLERAGDAIHLWPTSRWQPGEVVRLDYDVNLNPVTPAGRYRVVIDVPPGSDKLVCGNVTVDR